MLKHEILNPLNIVSTSLENLEREIPETEHSIKYLKKTRRGIGRLGSIVQSLAEASSLEDALTPGTEEQFDLNELLNEYLDNYQNTHPLQYFRVQLPDQPIPFVGWPYAIEQMLDNLLNNAVDYSDPGKPIDIMVSMNGDDDIDNIQISILNEGAAIPEDIRDTLFESMVTSRKESNPDQPHLGLGLYIVRLVADHHNGTVIYKNREDVEGSTFTVTINL